MATASNVVVRRGLQQAGQGLFSDQWFVSCTLDPGSLTNGSSEVETVTVPGVAVGDTVETISIGNATSGFIVSGQVTAANTVSLVLSNYTGGTVDLASSTWKFVVNRWV